MGMELDIAAINVAVGGPQGPKSSKNAGDGKPVPTLNFENEKVKKSKGVETPSSRRFNMEDVDVYLDTLHESDCDENAMN